MKVDLIIGGASKSGTTAIYDMLRQCPDFFVPTRKELHYFSKSFLNVAKDGPGDAAVVAQIPSTLNEYLDYFAGKAPDQVAVDISPSYLFHNGTATAIARELPDVKVLFILRRPEEKVYSQYLHLVGEGRETLSFEKALEVEAERKASGYSDMWLYAESGFYADAIATFQAALGRDRVKVVLFQDFRREPDLVLRELCRFAGLNGSQTFNSALEANVSGAPRSIWLARAMAPNSFTNGLRRVLPARSGQIIRRVMRGVNTGAKPKLAAETRKALQARYAEDIVKLEEVIGCETGWLVHPTLTE